jgi:excisionase family DNA binding protein
MHTKLATLQQTSSHRVIDPRTDLLSNPRLCTYLSPTEVARLIPISLKTLEKKRARGEGPKWRTVGRRVLYKWADVVAWIESGGEG